jgi:hypothetical protein
MAAAATALSNIKEVPPEALVSMVRLAADVAQEAMESAKLPLAIVKPAAGSGSGPSMVLQQHVPFVASLLLTAVKCAALLAADCPKLALELAGNISCMRARSPANATALHAAMASAEDLRKLGGSEIRKRMQTLPKEMYPPWVQQVMQTSLPDVSDSRLEIMMQMLDDASVRRVLTAGVYDAAAAEHERRFGRRFGMCSSVEAVLAGGLVTFGPGGVINSSSNSSSGGTGGDSSSSSSVFWYNAQEANAITPWLTVAARSMWLMGQLLSDLLPGGSNSSSSSGSSSGGSAHMSLIKELMKATGLSLPACPPDFSMVDAAFFQKRLNLAFACVEWIGSQLCHMQLPGNDPATLRSSFGPEDAAARMPLLAQLLQQHAQLQQSMFAALQRSVAAASAPQGQQYSVKSAGAAALLQCMWGDVLPGQLRAFGAAVAAALPVGWACNNAACANLGKLSELQLVTGKAKVCAGCKQVRMCSAECQKQHWKAGHKLVCKKLAAAAEGHTTAASSDSAAATAGSSISDAASSSSSAAAVAAAAGLELPTTAAAAAGLPVRRLKAVLVALDVAGVAGAAEKCELVQLLVGHLGLA